MSLPLLSDRCSRVLVPNCGETLLAQDRYESRTMLASTGSDQKRLEPLFVHPIFAWGANALAFVSLSAGLKFPAFDLRAIFCEEPKELGAIGMKAVFCFVHQVGKICSLREAPGHVAA